MQRIYGYMVFGILMLSLVGCERSAEQQLTDGIAAYMARDYAEARAAWEPLAAGSVEGVADPIRAEAGARLALLYLDGQGVGEDRDKARTLAQPAIAAKSEVGRYLQAVFLHEGLGQPRDDAAALTLLKPLAECGMPAAENLFAILNRALDRREDFSVFEYQFLEDASFAGYLPAQHTLAWAYLDKNAPWETQVQGLSWIWVSASLGSEVAVEEKRTFETTFENQKKTGQTWTANLLTEMLEKSEQELKGLLKIRSPFNCR